jgi:hypothetical protein
MTIAPNWRDSTGGAVVTKHSGSLKYGCKQKFALTPGSLDLLSQSYCNDSRRGLHTAPDYVYSQMTDGRSLDSKH